MKTVAICPDDERTTGVSMPGGWNNRYVSFMDSDNDLCLPVVQKEKLNWILAETTRVAESIVGKGAQPKFYFDLEQLQVVDYANFTKNPLQQKAIRSLQKSAPVPAAEMAYLALRSLIGLSWDDAESEEGVQRAGTFEYALEVVLTQVAQSQGEDLESPNALLPYWGRLGFLRVMATIPDEQIDAHSLDNFACVLLKDPAFNARSYRYDTHGLIGLNYALEPILKCLNRMLLHFFHTQHLAGPRRLERVWASLLPVAIYFQSISAVPVRSLARYHVLLDSDIARYSHTITASQVDFIIRHELGHLALDHGRRMQATSNKDEPPGLRNEFEFAADAFAQQALRSALYNRLRFNFEMEEPAGETAPTQGVIELLHEFQAESNGVRLLFIYMDVIEEIGKLLTQRLNRTGHTSSIRPNTHPSARERLNRLDLFQASEYPITSKLIRYAEDLFAQAIKYGEALDDAAFAAAIRTATANPD